MRWGQGNVSLTPGTCYITGVNGAISEYKMLLYTYIQFLGVFLISVFIIFNFSFFFLFFFFFFIFEKLSNFHNRILTNQKPELVITNCMDLNGLYYMDFLAVLVNVSSNYMREIGLVLAHLDMRKNATVRECLLSTSPFFISIVYCVFALEFFHSFTKMFCSCRF